jgi:hypothetical protein
VGRRRWWIYTRSVAPLINHNNILRLAGKLLLDPVVAYSPTTGPMTHTVPATATQIKAIKELIAHKQAASDKLDLVLQTIVAGHIEDTKRLALIEIQDGGLVFREIGEAQTDG